MRQILETAGLAVSSLLVAIMASWIVLALFSFSYPIWHDTIGINQAIEGYGPQNKFKTGFEQTTKEQRVVLFAQINKAVHSGGQGLAEISYKVDGHPEQTLLREPEVVHLQDVANLISFGMKVAGIAFIAWVFMWAYMRYYARKIPSFKMQMFVITGFFALLSTTVVAVGAKEIFYALHELVFPHDHQWFFYYQESLMATLMFAPNLFGWIAMELVVVTIILYPLLQFAAKRLAEKTINSPKVSPVVEVNEGSGTNSEPKRENKKKGNSKRNKGK